MKKVTLAIVVLIMFLVITQAILPTYTQETTEVGVYIRTVDLNGEPICGAIVNIYDENMSLIHTTETNSTGWAYFKLKNETYYSFTAMWMNATIGNLTNIYVSGTTQLTLSCKLTNIKIRVLDESGNPIPHVNVNFNYTYIDIFNRIQKMVQSIKTDENGFVILRHALVNANYTITVKRHGIKFYEVNLTGLNATTELSVTCPKSRLLVHVEDKNGNPVSNANVKVLDWGTSILIAESKTDNNGNTEFYLTVGRYKLEVRKQEFLINETYVSVRAEETSITIKCVGVNLFLKVKVVDSLGNPIRNAKVSILRGKEVIAKLTTDDKGEVSLSGLYSGIYIINVYIGEELRGVERVELANSKSIIVRVGDSILIAGSLVKASTLLTTSVVLVGFLTIACIELLRKRKQSL